jgi:erythromycin esterase-like protein
MVGTPVDLAGVLRHRRMDRRTEMREIEMSGRTMAAVVLTDRGNEWWSTTMEELADWMRMRAHSDSAPEVIALYGLDGAGEPVKLDFKVSQGDYDGSDWAMAEVVVSWPDRHTETRSWVVDGRA